MPLPLSLVGLPGEAEYCFAGFSVSSIGPFDAAAVSLRHINTYRSFGNTDKYSIGVYLDVVDRSEIFTWWLCFIFLFFPHWGHTGAGDCSQCHSGLGTELGISHGSCAAQPSRHLPLPTW